MHVPRSLFNNHEATITICLFIKAQFKWILRVKARGKLIGWPYAIFPNIYTYLLFHPFYNG